MPSESKRNPLMGQPEDVRAFILSKIVIGAIFIGCPFALAQDVKTTKRTFTYKTVDQCKIQADVYTGNEAKNRPVVIWIHGGTPIMGHRSQTDPKLLANLIESCFDAVSSYYRLAPETKLPAILEDVEDACKWVRLKGPELFGIDPNRIAVMGGSAGGYLTLAAGFRVEPRPKALVSFWGYGDIAGDWYSRPDPFYSKQPAVPKQEAYGAVGDQVISESSGKNNRHRFYLYCRQNGLWPKEVAGLDPPSPRPLPPGERGRGEGAFDRFCPVRNVTAKYPPTLLVHGTKDTDVPYEQSEMMAKELDRNGVKHELITVRDAGHGLAGAKPEVMEKMQERVIAFLKEHVSPKD
jgi:acetyl esterase/lipase